jgi:hypothetical protein
MSGEITLYSVVEQTAEIQLGKLSFVSFSKFSFLCLLRFLLSPVSINYSIFVQMEQYKTDSSKDTWLYYLKLLGLWFCMGVKLGL